jgi:hypothetical protein
VFRHSADGIPTKTGTSVPLYHRSAATSSLPAAPLRTGGFEVLLECIPLHRRSGRGGPNRSAKAPSASGKHPKRAGAIATANSQGGRAGPSSFRGCSHDVDVYVFGTDEPPPVAEVKARKKGAGFTQLETWLGEYILLVLRRNHADPMIMLPWRTWAALLRRGRR